MVSIAGAPNALETRLSELAGFGLGRPANVLFSEYVKVLEARGVIDAATAERLSLGFYAAHFGDLNAEDRRVSEAVARLEDVTARLAAMPVELRLELSERVQNDLQTMSENVARSPVAKEPLATEPAWEAPPATVAVAVWDPEPPSTEFADEGLIRSVAVRAADTDLKRRRLRRLTLLVPAAFGLFVAGFASSGPIRKFLRPDRPDVAPAEAAQKKLRVVERQPSKEALLYEWAVAETGARHHQKASLAYELLLTYQPKDAKILNNLAWLYLTTKDSAVHNPQRGLELAKRAIALRRRVEYLDTAAEAHFQTGNPQEAVKLENEALRAPELPSFGPAMESFLRRQLDKFEAASKPGPPAPATPARAPVPMKVPPRLRASAA